MPIKPTILGTPEFSARFWAKVRQTHTCWVGMGVRNPSGYGYFRWNGRSRPAHRAAYEHLVGPIPAGLHIDHLCRNRACVNPAHLEAVTPSENIRRGAGFKSHCPQGHPYSPENTRLKRVGKYVGKVCLTCHRAGVRAAHRRRRERQRV